MKRLMIILLCTISLQANAQIQHKSRGKNKISLESGLWSRGAVGISYSRYFAFTEIGNASFTGGYGIGYGFDGPSQYGTLNLSYLFGPGNLQFSAGIEGKYYYISDIFTLFEGVQEGFTAAPSLALNAHTESGIGFELRASAIPMFRGYEIHSLRPSIGISVGKEF